MDKQQQNELLKRIDALCERYFGTPDFNVQTIILETGFNGQRLRRNMLKLTGMSTSSYLSVYMVGRAKRMMEQDPSVSIFEVSHACGFDEPTHFARAFRRVTGMTPRAYRRQLREKKQNDK